MDMSSAALELSEFLKDGDLPVDKISKIVISRLASDRDDVRQIWSDLVSVILESNFSEVCKTTGVLFGEKDGHRYDRFREILTEDIQVFWNKFADGA